MSQYPVQTPDDLYDAANYALSGPGGTGQNLQGFTQSIFQALINPAQAEPYVLPTTTGFNTDLYVDIPINNIVITSSPLDDLITATFTTPLSTAPFQFGELLLLANVTPGAYDGEYRVFASTATDVTLQLLSGSTNTLPAYTSGGNIIRNLENLTLATDCFAEVTVDGPTDRVTVSADAEISLTYGPAGTTPYELDIVVRIIRLRLQPPDSPYQYIETGVVAQRIYHIVDSAASNTATVYPVFTTVIDRNIDVDPSAFEYDSRGSNLPAGTYRYILAVNAVNTPNVFISGYQTGQGSLTDIGFTGSGQQNQSVVPGTTFVGIVPTVTGTGTSVTMDITLYPDPANPNYNIDTDPNYQNTEISITAQSDDFKIGDILTVPGTSLGGATPANDLTMVVSQIEYPGLVDMGTVTLGYRTLSAAVIKQ